MLTIQEGARKIVNMCMGVRAGEHVIVITDTKRPASLGKATFGACLEVGAETTLITFDGSMINGQLNDQISAAIEHADVLLCITTSTLAYTNAVYKCKANGCRVACITDVTEDSFMKGAIECNYEGMAPVVEHVRKAFLEAKEAEITSPGGTHLKLSIDGRRPFTCPGRLSDPGGLIGLPAMEVYIAPIEDKTNGVLVADASGSRLGILEEPVRFTIENGKAVKIEGGRQAKELAEFLESTKNPNSYTIAEFAIGLNPCAQLCGSIAVDEGIYGTGHYALGNNLGFEGKNMAPNHLDMVYWKPTIYLDGKLFMKDGELLGWHEQISEMNK